MNAAIACEEINWRHIRRGVPLLKFGVTTADLSCVEETRSHMMICVRTSACDVEALRLGVLFLRFDWKLRHMKPDASLVVLLHFWKEKK
jgi:hypothetical protein